MTPSANSSSAPDRRMAAEGIAEGTDGPAGTEELTRNTTSRAIVVAANRGISSW